MKKTDRVLNGTLQDVLIDQHIELTQLTTGNMNHGEKKLPCCERKNKATEIARDSVQKLQNTAQQAIRRKNQKIAAK